MLAVIRDEKKPPSSVLVTCNARKSSLVGSTTGRPRYSVDCGASGRSTRVTRSRLDGSAGRETGSAPRFQPPKAVFSASAMAA